MLGWDVTDFGSDDYNSRGLFLFTIRNGRIGKDDKTYAEKIMISKVNQETPMHFHWYKMEDIINRCGEQLVLELYNSTSDEGFSDKAFFVKRDGVSKQIQPGGKVVLEPGESICLEKGIYHRFWGEKSMVLVGEVNMVNNNSADNRFYEKMGRFPEIEEDCQPLHLLASDYQKYLDHARLGINKNQQV